MCREKDFKLFKIYSCPVMYLNKTFKSDNIKKRPVVILNILEGKEKSYGLILGSSSENNKRSERYILAWELKTKDNSRTSYFDFSRFVRTVELNTLGYFHNYDGKEVNLDSKLIKELKLKFNNLLSPRFKQNRDDPLNGINWHIYTPDKIKDEYNEIIDFSKKFINEPDYILILNRFYINSPNTLVIGLYLENYTEHNIKIDLSKNHQIKNILYADLRTITIVNINEISLVKSPFTSLSIEQVDFIKDTIKAKVNFKQNLSTSGGSRTNDKDNNLLDSKVNSIQNVWDTKPSTSKKPAYKNDEEWPEL